MTEIEIEGQESPQAIFEEIKVDVEEKPSDFDPTFKKNINHLTKEETDRIIHNISIGNQYEHFDVKEFKNGSKRIIKRKEPTTRSVALKNSSKPSLDPSKVYLTDNQILMEHIIKLNKKVEKLKLKNMEYDDLIYGEGNIVSGDFVSIPNPTPPPEQLRAATTQGCVEKISQENIPKEEEQNIPKDETPPITPQRKAVRRSWRDNIKYLP
jgi:hypothetical protein